MKPDTGVRATTQMQAPQVKSTSDLVVVDMSHYQPTPDWQALIDDGIVGVIHKATEGTSYKDPTLFERARPAMDAGLKWSTYHFLRPGDMREQMDWYLNTIDPVQGERVCLDHEDSGVSLADLKEAVSYLIADPRGLQVTIYSGHVIKEQLSSGKDVYLAENTSLWLAQYSSTPSWPTATWPQWTLWQFTENAAVPGISGNVDGNRFNGTPENCARWFGPAGSEPAPSPEPAKIVNIAIDTDDGVEVRVTVNGELL